MKHSTKNNLSPAFHQGELEVQKRLGINKTMDDIGRMRIRDFMPDQHRQFFQQLPMILVGHTDANHDIWASILVNPTFTTADLSNTHSSHQFIESPTSKKLNIYTTPLPGDPLNVLLETVRQEQKRATNDNKQSTRLGLLGIELSTRRRNRLNAEILSVNENGLTLNVVQSFGNCPQYIQTREFSSISPTDMPKPEIKNIDHFDSTISEFISQCDTFFVASSNHQQSVDAKNNSDGTDVSHRGGQAGFIRVDDETTLTIPDYRGNSFFNTLGNFTSNPKAGLLFIDFAHGHIISLTGAVEILWDSPEQKDFLDAERLWRFRLHKGKYLKNTLPLRWYLKEDLPKSLPTCTIKHTINTNRPLLKNDWSDYTVEKIENENEYIRSFYLSPQTGSLPTFLPGQFITIQVVMNGKPISRNYSLSSSPQAPWFRISVKREQKTDKKLKGIVSHFLHDSIQIGDKLKAQLPNGQFTLDTSIARPAVLLSAGVGITPILSMAKSALHAKKSHQGIRPLIIISSFRNHKHQIFTDEIEQISRASKGMIRHFTVLSQPEKESLLEHKDIITGRINKKVLQQLLPLDDYECYLCGPNQFMQNMYDLLQELGVRDKDIFAEAFGPAALQRNLLDNTDKLTPPKPSVHEAKHATVIFASSQQEYVWTSNDSHLLDFAEAQGLTPHYGCRNGQCGSCRVNILQGEVIHTESSGANVGANEALLCCAKPAEHSGTLTEKLILDI